MRFNNKKTKYNGVIYDSKGEAYLAQHLDQLVRDGYITKVERQIPFTLYKDGKKDCKHVVDFIITLPNGKKEIREFKGLETERWLYKLRLFIQNYPDIPYITIKENRLNRYTSYTPEEILEVKQTQLLVGKHKYAWYEVAFAFTIHYIAGIFIK